MWWLFHPVSLVIFWWQIGQRPFCSFQRELSCRFPFRLCTIFTPERSSQYISPPRPPAFASPPLSACRSLAPLPPAQPCPLLPPPPTSPPPPPTTHSPS